MENKNEKSELLKLLDSATIDIPKEEWALLTKMAEKENKKPEQTLYALIREKCIEKPKTQLEITGDCNAALEMVWCQLNDTDDITELRSQIAGDLIVSRAALEMEKNGKLDKEKIREWALELFT